MKPCRTRSTTRCSDASSRPTSAFRSRIGGYFYYSRTEEGKQYPFMCRRKGSMDGAEEMLLDLNELAEGTSSSALGAYVVSDDGNWLAYSTRHDRLPPVHAAREGPDAAGRLWPRTSSGSARWSGPADNKTLFYTTEDAVSKRSDRFWRHIVGQPTSDLVYRGEGRAVQRRRRTVARRASSSRLATPRRRPRSATCRAIGPTAD